MHLFLYRIVAMYRDTNRIVFVMRDSHPYQVVYIITTFDLFLDQNDFAELELFDDYLSHTFSNSQEHAAESIQM